MPDQAAFHSLQTFDPAHDPVLDAAPAVASAFLFQMTAQTLAVAGQNATMAQQQMQILAQAVTAMCATELLAEEPEAAEAQGFEN